MDLKCLFGHKWNNNGTGCLCRVCGKKRDAGHDWNACTCRVCKKNRDSAHDFVRYSPTVVSASGAIGMCAGQCRVCGKTDTRPHDYHTMGKPCVLKCSRCLGVLERHRFTPIPGRCAEVCSVCGEERDYQQIALDENMPRDKRVDAVGRLKAMSMIPGELYRRCQEGQHLYTAIRESRQQFRGGTSYIEYECAVCGKKET